MQHVTVHKFLVFSALEKVVNESSIDYKFEEIWNRICEYNNLITDPFSNQDQYFDIVKIHEALRSILKCCDYNNFNKHFDNKGEIVILNSKYKINPELLYKYETGLEYTSEVPSGYVPLSLGKLCLIYNHKEDKHKFLIKNDIGRTATVTKETIVKFIGREQRQDNEYLRFTCEKFLFHLTDEEAKTCLIICN